MVLNKSIKKITIVSSIALLLAVSANMAYANSKVDINNKEINISENIKLDKEAALNILLNYNSEIEYEYFGTEQDFEVLKEKNLEGYVFLPNVDTDLGLFVDKNTKEISNFHPSGWLELVK